MKRWILLGIVVTIIMAVATAVLLTPKSALFVVQVDGVRLRVEVADEHSEQVRGLMFRTQLPRDQGMLFIFEKEDKYAFWMMNVMIPLDMIWFDSNGIAIHIVEGAVPCSIGCGTYTPSNDAKYVLEVNKGFVTENRVHLGSRLTIG